jgi:uncharacterized repeat protein (TIGR03847 family)
LLAETGEGAVSLWLEKEQVVMLGSAIDEVLKRVPARAGEGPAAAASGSFVGDLEIKVGSIAVGFDSEHLGYSIEAGDFESPFELEGIRLITGRETFSRLSGEIGDIVARGRPRCPLCGTPLAGGSHFCPESNGHAALSPGGQGGA